MSYIIVLVDVDDYIVIVDRRTSCLWILTALYECPVQATLLRLHWWVHHSLLHLHWLELVKWNELSVLVVLEVARIHSSEGRGLFRALALLRLDDIRIDGVFEPAASTIAGAFVA